VKLASEKLYSLDDTIRDRIQYLDTIIEVPPEITETVPLRRINRSFDRGIRRNGHRRKGSSREDIANMAADMEAVRNFKATKMEEKVGIEKQLNTIRMQLNKLSAKNYENQKDIIVECIMDILGDDESEENHVRISQTVFDIASANKVLSEVYADLYVELIGKNDLFGAILDGLVVKYRASLDEIVFVDPDVDYNGFCDYNKKNDLRKASVTFIMNLMKRSMISHQSILDLICELQDRTLEYIEEDNKTNEVDEITENMFLLITIGKDVLCKTNLWSDKVKPFVRKFVTLKVKEYSSLSSRCVFKYMDMKL
jgi:hypothetical protein